MSKELNPVKKLQDALKFVKPVMKKTGSIQQQFCKIENHMLTASDGIVTVGTPIDEDLNACPQLFKLEEALKKVSSTLSISQLSDLSMTVNSDEFKAYINCVPVEHIEVPQPDENIASCDNLIKDAFKLLEPLANEKEEKPTLASVLLQGNTAFATNDHALIEFWHGIDLPPNMLIPKKAAKIISKVKKNLTGFGYAGSSCTFWFEDGSFIKTQLFEDNFPAYSHLFNCESDDFFQLEDSFFKAINAIKEFTKDGFIWFKDGKLATTKSGEEASSHLVDKLPEGMAFNYKYLLFFKKGFSKACFIKSEDGRNDKGFFYGDRARGIVLGGFKDADQ